MYCNVVPQGFSLTQLVMCLSFCHEMEGQLQTHRAMCHSQDRQEGLNDISWMMMMIMVKLISHMLYDAYLLGLLDCRHVVTDGCLMTVDKSVFYEYLSFLNNLIHAWIKL